jgi:hypothetical protein
LRSPNRQSYIFFIRTFVPLPFYVLPQIAA